MGDGIPTRRVRFDYLADLEVTIRPAVADLNPLYTAAAIAWVHPLTLASMLPDDHPRALTEERATRALAKAYGTAVMAGSSTSEDLDRFTPDEWEAWLLDNPEEFASLRSIAGSRGIFVDESAVAGSGAI